MNPLKYERRGKRTFIVLLVLRLIPAFLFLLGVIILALTKNSILASLRISAGPTTPILTQGLSLIINSGFLLFIILCLILILTAWLQYISFAFAFDDAAFKTRHGIFNLTEISIPYRQIQDIDISRPLSYRLLGMSRIVILTAGREDTDNPERDHSESTIDLIENKIALELQHELLERSTLQAARILHPVDPTDVHKY